MKNPKTQPVVATGQPPNTPHRAKPWPEYRTPATPVVGCAGSLGLPLTGLALDRHKQQRGRGGYGASRGYAEAVFNQQRVDDHNCNKNGVSPKARLLDPIGNLLKARGIKNPVAQLPFFPRTPPSRFSNFYQKTRPQLAFLPGGDPVTTRTRPDPTRH